MPNQDVAVNWSLVVIHEGYTTTQKILERGFALLEQSYGLRYRIVEFRPDTCFSIGEYEIPLLVRCASPWVANFTEKLVEVGKPYLYFIDDNFWSIDLSTPLGQFYRSPGILTSLEKIISRASVAVTNTTVLAMRVRRMNRNTKIIPAYFDFSLIDDRVAHETATSKHAGTMRIGFASNHTRLPDFQPIEQTLLKILADYPNCELDVIGLTPELLRQHPSVNVFPHLDSYEAYIDFQLSRAWDVGLAPLRPSKQNAAKTNNKYREYAAMSIAGVYANEEPYREVIDRVNGMKAGPNPADWNDAIRALLEDEELRFRIVANGLAAVREQYGINHIMHKWFGELQTLANIDTHNLVDWYRDSMTAKYPRMRGYWYFYRTRGFRKVYEHFVRRVGIVARQFFKRNQIGPSHTVQTVVESSRWRAPRDRFTLNPPRISVVLTVTDTISLASLDSVLNAALRQQGVTFEVIIVVDSIRPDVIEYIDSVYEMYDNVGLITHEAAIDCAAISFAEGYLKTRGLHILPMTTEFVFAPDAFVRLNDPLPQDVKLAPICVVSVNSDLPQSNPEIFPEDEATISIWPARDHELKFIALIDRRIIESLGLEDPHPAISGFAKYDFWKRIIADYDVVHIEANIGSWRAENLIASSGAGAKPISFDTLKWSRHNRAHELQPIAIMNYDLPSNPKWFDANDDDVQRKSHGIAVVSFGAANDAELHFSYLPESIQRHMHLVAFRSVADFDESLFDHVAAIVWVSQNEEILSVMERARKRGIEQFVFASTEGSVDRHILESGLYAFVLAPKPETAEKLRLLSSTAKVYEFPFWLAESSAPPPLPASARKANSLTIGAFCDETSIDRFRTLITPALAQLAIKMRIDVRLAVVMSPKLHSVKWPENDRFSVERIPQSSSQSITIRRLGSKSPDFLFWSKEQRGTPLIGAGISRESIAALLGCFSVKESTENSRDHITIAIDASNGKLSLTGFFAELVQEPQLRQQYAKTNQSFVLHSHGSLQAKRILDELTKVVLHSHTKRAGRFPDIKENHRKS